MGKKILLIGCGNLGKILLTKWENNNLRVDVVEKNKRKVVSLKKTFEKLNFFYKLDDIKFEKYDFVVLCVKPNVSKSLLRETAKFINNKNIVISMIAGLKIKNIMSYFPDKNIILRAMPNIFSYVESSATGLFCKIKINEVERKKIEFIFYKLGVVYWVKKEDHMNFFTALFGGGPAYFFFFLKTIIDISKNNGFSVKDSKELVFSLLRGTHDFLNKNNENLESLISKVTSKGGTTEEAINYFKKDKIFSKIFETAILKAEEKSKYLSNN